MPSVKSLYLIVYNALCGCGWAYILSIVIKAIIANEDTSSVWEQVEIPLKTVQTFAILEIIHAAVGIVRSPLVITLMQVSSRLYCVWAVANVSIDAQTHVAFLLMVTSWSLAEIPRYAFYAQKLLSPNRNVAFLTFLRYHFFMVLYPTGSIGEVWSMYNSLPSLTNSYAITMPNAHNISVSLYSVMCITMPVYALCLPIMYSHMMSQRNRVYKKKSE